MSLFSITQLLSIARTLWHYLKEVCGENDYARYCQRALLEGRSPIPAGEFYVRRVEEKYSKINRCC